jgi:ABC-type multidrug transport system ATPase subunit
MKQRVKLLLAFMSDVPLLLLDEPLMNLDQPGTDWFLEMLTQILGKRTVIICSNNHEKEIMLCSEKIFIGNYKQ